MALRRLGEDNPNPNGAPDMPGPEEFQNMMLELLKMAMNEAIEELRTQAVRCILEERRNGKPGPEFELFQERMIFYMKIDPKDRMSLVLAARMVFLLAGAVEMLDGAEIDPKDLDYEDPGPLAGTDNDPRKK